MKSLELLTKPEYKKPIEKSGEVPKLGENVTFVIRLNLPCELKKTRDQLILFGNESSDFDGAYGNLDFGKVSPRIDAYHNTWFLPKFLRRLTYDTWDIPDAVTNSKIHELYHPISLFILQKLFPESNIKNLSLATEYLTIALNSRAFPDKNILTFSPIENIKDDKEYNFNMKFYTRKLISDIIVSAIKETNKEFLDRQRLKVCDANNTIEVQIPEYRWLNSESREYLVNYDFSGLDSEALIQKVLEMIERILIGYSQNSSKEIHYYIGIKVGGDNFQNVDKEFVHRCFLRFKKLNDPKKILTLLLC